MFQTRTRWLFRALRVSLGALLAALLVLAARSAGLLESAELAAYDALTRRHAGQTESRRIAVVIADEDDVQRFGWPLPDGVLAQLAERLLAAGADAVGFDIYRDRPTGEGGPALAAVLERDDRILWAYRLGSAERAGVAAPSPVAGTPRAGFADVVVDPGEVVRRTLLVATDPADGRNVLSLGTALATRMTKSSLRPAGDDLAFDSGTIHIIDVPYGPYVTVDAAGYQALLAFDGRFPVLTVTEALEGGVDRIAERVAGRGVLVGINALSVRDSFTTPLTTGLAHRQALPGVLLHAYTAEQLLRTADGQQPVPSAPSRPIETAMILGASGAGGLIPLGLPVVGWALLTMVLSVVALGAIALAALWAFGLGWLLPAVPAALAVALAAVAVSWLLQGTSYRQRLQLRRAFEHYLDPALVGVMVNNEELPSLGGEQRVITAMFTDITDFTTLAEGLPPAQLAALLNEYLEGICQAVVRNGGLVADFIGDAVLALFGAPVAQPDHAQRAVAAALAADRFASGFSSRLLRSGISFGITRIGVHTGSAIVGNMGSRARLKYGAVGDTLNVAARLESLNRWTGTRVLVSESTAAQDGAHRFGLIGKVVVKGRGGRTAVFSPAEWEEGEDLYAEALAAVAAGELARARACWDLLARTRPDDPVVAFHRARLKQGVCTLEIVPGGK